MPHTVREEEPRLTQDTTLRVDRNPSTAKREDPDSAQERLHLRDGGTTTPARTTLKRLPLLNEPFILRAAAVLGVARKRCDRCMHWSKEGARAVFKAHPHFAMAAEFLSPARMAAAQRKEFDEIGQPVGHAETKTTWDDFGTCPKVGVITAHDAVCDAFE